MFHRPLRSSFLLAIPLALVAGAAEAVVDIEEVTLEITFARSSVVSDSFSAEFRVTGTDLNNGTITFPAAPTTQVGLDKDGDDLFLDLDGIDTETELNALFTNGNYVLRVNNGAVQATIAYTRPLVPDPAITQPGAGSIVPPDPIEVQFTECAVCNQAGDSVQALLEDETQTVVIDEETLTSSAEEWIPQDGMMGDLDLPEDTGFVVSITHSALRQANVVTSPTDDDGFFLFNNRFIQSDEIDFRTGFEPPVGAFCLSSNFTAPPMGCAQLNDANLQVVDTSGSFTTQVDGHDVDYTVVTEASGSLSGSASGDLDDSGMNETGPAPIKGKLSGKGDGTASQKLSFSLAGDAPPAKVKVSIAEDLSIPGNSQQLVQKNSGSIDGVKIKEEISQSNALPYPPRGWLLEFTLDDAGVVMNPVLTLEGGRNFPLSGTNKFSFASNESSLKLTSDPKGISVQLKKVILDDTVDPMAIDAGDLSTKILGQSGRASFAP